MNELVFAICVHMTVFASIGFFIFKHPPKRKPKPKQKSKTHEQLKNRKRHII